MSSVQETNLKAIADAIRAKEKSTGAIKASTFPQRIAAIQTGVTPKLVVTTSAGASVTATKDSNTVSGTAGTDGTCTLELPEAGEWGVAVTKDGSSRRQSIVIGTQNLSIPLYDPIFANNTWEQIVNACQNGAVPDTWAVGDNKVMIINETEYQIDIIGKNHDDYADGSGKAPLTFQTHSCYMERSKMNTSMNNNVGWENCVVRSTLLPAILGYMPSEVQNGIREVSKKTSVGNGRAADETSDTLFLLSEVEIFETKKFSVEGEGTQYDYYKAGNSVRKTSYDGNNTLMWWERSPHATDSVQYCAVSADTSSNQTSYIATAEIGIAFAFCF